MVLNATDWLAFRAFTLLEQHLEFGEGLAIFASARGTFEIAELRQRDDETSERLEFDDIV